VHELVHRHELHGGDAEAPDRVKDRRRRQAGVGAAQVLGRMDEGLPKLWTTSRALRLKARVATFADPESACTPLELRGPAAARAVGFLRGDDVAVVVPIRTWAPDWSDTHVRLPEGRWDHVLAETAIDGGAVALDALFGAFPVALLERRSTVL
jgi:(1->4)-alpha-D-glucan 1-alpha-D-glucosylmutase